MKATPLLVAALLAASLAGACKSDDEPRRPEGLEIRDAPIGVAFALEQDRIVYRGSSSYRSTTHAAPEDAAAPVEAAVRRSRIARHSFESGDRAVFNALAGDVLEVDRERLVFPRNGLVELRRAEGGLEIATSTGQRWSGASVVVLREYGFPERQPIQSYENAEALFFLGYHVADALLPRR